MRHPIVHNEIFVGIKRARWKEDELRRVAHMKIENGDLVNINQCIASKLSGRTDEAVEKVRGQRDYLEILEDLRRQATDGRANLVSSPNKRYRTIEPLLASELNEYLEDGDEAIFRSQPEVSIPQFEGATLEARSLRTTALLDVEGKSL